MGKRKHRRILRKVKKWQNIMTKQEREELFKKKAIDRLGLKLNLDNPQTVQDKIVWLMINDSEEMTKLKGRCADKILVHEYCKEKLGTDICVPILKVYNNPNDINFNELPNKFVLKANHGYAMNIIVDKQKNKYTTLKKYDIKNENDCKKVVSDWLNYRFGDITGERHYSYIEPKCFVEKFMDDGHTTLTDYKVWCCNGEPKMIQVISDRYTGNLHANIYDTEWKWIDLGWNDFKQDKEHLDKKPVELDKMLDYARKLSKDFTFVRVDFYVINNQIYLGELTFTPDGGVFKYKDKNTELFWGSQIKLSKKAEDKIIVSFTSWKKRIQYCKHVFEIMLKQTVKPDKIILNLSSDEFPTKEKELPSDLVSFVNNNNTCEINWVKENNKVWKKFMPILDRFKDDVIIPIDDDIEYPIYYVEKMYEGYLKYNKECPIVCFKNVRENNVLSHSGPFSLIKKDFFGKYLNDLYDNLICKNKDIHWQSDEIYSYAIWLNGKRYKYVDAIDAANLYSTSTLNKIDAYSNYRDGFSELMKKIRSLTSNYIKTKYNKTYDELFHGEIIVNFTTWKKRQGVVHEMLTNFAKQKMKPNKIICWLSSSEYNNKIPEDLLKCKKEGLLDEIRFVSGNTFAHKRWQTLKENNDKYNIIIDDDIYYDPNFISELYNCAIKNQGCAIIWCSDICEFVGNQCNIIKNPSVVKSRKNQVLSGLACYPPYTLSNIIFKNIELRDKWCTKCDDSWIRSCIVKDHIDVVRVHDRSRMAFKTIEGTQNVGVWETENKNVNSFGTKRLYENFANALVINDAVKEAKAIWPKFDIYRCCSQELLKALGMEVSNNAKNEKQQVLNKPRNTNNTTNRLNDATIELMYGHIDGIDTGEYRMRKFNAIKRRVIKKH